jgi:hypothetical protein
LFVTTHWSVVLAVAGRGAMRTKFNLSSNAPSGKEDLSQRYGILTQNE